jgi:hypothetical protein
MNEVVKTIMEALIPVLTVLIGTLTTYLINYINKKNKDIDSNIETKTLVKYNNMITQTITDCVQSISQTYVDELKKTNSFTKEAQEEAFKRCYAQVLLLLSKDAKEYISTAFGDMETYLTNKIEAIVKEQKIA